MNAAERIRETRVYQDFGRDFHKPDNDTCGVAYPKIPPGTPKTG
jgi:hypothetical protein